MQAEQEHLRDYVSRQGLAAEPNLYQEYLVLWQRFRYVAWGLMAVAIFLGISANLAVFRAGDNQGNIFILLFLLLAPNFFSLLLWLYSLAKHPSPIYELCQWGAKLATKIPFIEVSKSPSTQQCLVGYIFQNPYGQWLAASVTHGFWFIYLLVGSVTFALYLSFNQVSFYWETTLLNESHFLALTHALSIIPGWFGLAEPSAQALTHSQLGSEQSQEIRLLWAVWLLVCVVLYGVLPRVFLWLLCTGLYVTTKRRYLRSKTLASYHQQWHHQVLDPDTAPPANPNHPPQEAELLPLTSIPSHGGLFGFEWQDDVPTELRHLAYSAVNNRDEQQTCLDFLAQTKEPVMMLLPCTTAPDRGSRRFLQQVSQHDDMVFVLANRPYQLAWQQLLCQLSVAPARLYRFSETQEN